MFIAALLTIAETWKQPKCPSTDEWIKKMRYIYRMEYHSDIKKNDIMPFAATWLDLEIIILIEGSHREKDKYHIILLIYGTKNMTQMNLSIKQKQIQDIENRLMVAKIGRGGRGGMDWEFGISRCRCKLLCIEWIINKVLLYGTGNYSQHPVINHNGKEYKKECIYIYMHESLFCIAEISTHCKSIILQ